MNSIPKLISRQAGVSKLDYYFSTEVLFARTTQKTQPLMMGRRVYSVVA
jgi:hypothetical protein